MDFILPMMDKSLIKEEARGEMKSEETTEQKTTEVKAEPETGVKAEPAPMDSTTAIVPYSTSSSSTGTTRVSPETIDRSLEPPTTRPRLPAPQGVTRPLDSPETTGPVTKEMRPTTEIVEEPRAE